MESNWAERTIVVSGIPEGILSTSRMIDKLTIHFLRLRNGGGEVENIIYPVDATGMAYVTFEKGEVVESVLRQKEQVLEDKRLPVKYPLKISQYSEDVFMQVSVDLDLSMFGESLELKKLVREHQSNNKTLRFSNDPNGTMHIEGSFSAIKELRKDFTRIAGELLVIDPQSSVSKSGLSASERKLVKPASNDATQMTEPQKLAASPSYGTNDVLHPGVFEEETTIILDADIFTYISMFFKEKFEAVFLKNYVSAKEIKCDDITVLQLQQASERCQPSQLMTTKFEIETLISQMQQSLVTEKIRLDGDRGQNKRLEICKETMQGFPEVWVRITDEYVTLVGNVNDCKQFRKEVEEKVKAGQSDPTFSGHSGIPNATGYSHQFGQSLGSNAADRLDVSNASKCSRHRNSHSDQYMMSQVDSCQTSCSRNDAHGKWGSSHCGGGPLINRQPSSLPISLSMSSSPMQDRQSENTARSERSKNNRHY